MTKVCVVGAGIIGSTTAFKILERLGSKVSLDIVAEAFSPDTTSDVAAGLWEPHLIGGTPKEKVDKWGSATFELFHKLWNDPDSLGEELSQLSVAVSLCPATFFGKEGEDFSAEKDEPWKHTVMGYEKMDQRELARFRALGGTDMVGATFTTYTFDTQKALPIFYRILKGRGARMIRRRVESLRDLAASYDLVVNCTGVGAAQLVGDRSVVPTSGHVLRVRAPWINSAMGAVVNEDGDFAYIIPNRECVVVGSIDTPNNWSRLPLSPGDGGRLLKNGAALIPRLSHAEVIAENIGLRPVRKWGVRIEYEEVAPDLKVLHNYGHGGCGVTLSWGCAEEAAKLLESVLLGNRHMMR